MAKWRDRVIISKLNEEQIAQTDEYRWIEVFCVLLSRGDVDVDDFFDQSSGYVRTTVRYFFQAVTHKLNFWEQQRLLVKGLSVEEGDIIISNIPLEYSTLLDSGVEMVIHTPDMTSSNSVIAKQLYPADELESTWTVIARRKT